MLVTTTDPTSANDVNNIDEAPYVVEGEGTSALKIYFESEQNRQSYLEISLKSPGSSSVELYNDIKDKKNIGHDQLDDNTVPVNDQLKTLVNYISV